MRQVQKRYDEALATFNKSREIFENLGEPASVATLWHQTGIVYEAAEGNVGAAVQARLKAFELYLAYRQDGGENYDFGGRLCHEFRQALIENRRGEVATGIEELAKRPDMTAMAKLLIGKLLAMLGGPSTRTPGSREAELWMDEGLWYMDAVEIKMLLEEE